MREIDSRSSARRGDVGEARRQPDRGKSAKTKLVPLAGLEPARCCHHLILSQARLPIPPQGHVIDL